MSMKGWVLDIVFFMWKIVSESLAYFYAVTNFFATYDFSITLTGLNKYEKFRYT